MKESRNVTIDICKGVGILLVVIGHLPTLFGGIIYSFHMGLFFMLSGWVFNESYLDSKLTFIKKRTVSILLPYVVFRGTSFLITKMGIWENYHAIEEEYHLIGTLWFLKDLFLASLISLFLLWLLRKTTTHYRLIAPIITLALTFAAQISIGETLANIFFITTFYLLGIFFRQYEDRIRLSPLLDYKSFLGNMGGAFLWLLVAVSIRTTINTCDLATYLPYMATSVLGSYYTVRFCMMLKERDIWVTPLVFIGQNTMPILLLQWPAFAIIDIMMQYDIIHPNNIEVIILKFMSGVIIPLFLDSCYQSVKKLVLRGFTSNRH